MIVEHGIDGGIVIGDHEARAVESLCLVDQHVASFVIGIIGHHHSTGHGTRLCVLCVQKLYQLSCLRAWSGTHVQYLYVLNSAMRYHRHYFPHPYSNPSQRTLLCYVILHHHYHVTSSHVS